MNVLNKIDLDYIFLYLNLLEYKKHCFKNLKNLYKIFIVYIYLSYFLHVSYQ